MKRIPYSVWMIIHYEEGMKISFGKDTLKHPALERIYQNGR